MKASEQTKYFGLHVCLIESAVAGGLIQVSLLKKQQYYRPLNSETY